MLARNMLVVSLSDNYLIIWHSRGNDFFLQKNDFGLRKKDTPSDVSPSYFFLPFLREILVDLDGDLDLLERLSIPR